ncbi:hypothetical protein ACFX2G_044363 [Malus domestica]
MPQRSEFTSFPSPMTLPLPPSPPPRPSKATPRASPISPSPLGSPPSIRSTAPSPSSLSNATADPSASATRRLSSFLRCRNLTRLKIRAYRELTDAGMTSLAKNCKKLKKSQDDDEGRDGDVYTQR